VESKWQLKLQNQLFESTIDKKKTIYSRLKLFNINEITREFSCAMPKEYSHLLIGKSLLHILRNKQDPQVEVSSLNPSSFLLGNTSPDLLFYDFPTFRYRRLAKFLHSGRGENSFRIITSLISKSTSTEQVAGSLYSFALGYLGHLAADMVWHPLVLKCCQSCPKIPKAPKCTQSMSCHFRIESLLDLVLGKHLRYQMKKKDFPHWIALYSQCTRELLWHLSNEINKSGDAPLSSNANSLYRCLVTQVTFLSLFQVKSLFWASLAMDLLTLRKFDQYQALFYPPPYVLGTDLFRRLSPGITKILLQEEDTVVKALRDTERLALKFFDIAEKQKTGNINEETAYFGFLNLSPSTGIDGHL